MDENELYEYIGFLFDEEDCIVDLDDCYRDWKKDFVYFDMYECDSYIIIKLK